MPICSYSPPVCGREALPDSRPRLCARHAHLVICPTCSDWRVMERVYCPTCPGTGLCGEDRARWALATCTRRRDRERHPAEEDAKWGHRPYEADAPDLAPGSPVDESEGEGGYYPPDPYARTGRDSGGER